MRTVKSLILIICAVLAALALITPRLLAEQGDPATPAGVLGPLPASVQQAQPAGIEAGVLPKDALPPAVKDAPEVDQADQQALPLKVEGNDAGLLAAPPAEQQALPSDPSAAGIDVR